MVNPLVEMGIQSRRKSNIIHEGEKNPRMGGYTVEKRTGLIAILTKFYRPFPASGSSSPLLERKTTKVPRSTSSGTSKAGRGGSPPGDPPPMRDTGNVEVGSGVSSGELSLLEN